MWSFRNGCSCFPKPWIHYLKGKRPKKPKSEPQILHVSCCTKSDTMSKSDFDLISQNRSTESKIVASLERIAQAFRVLLWQESKEYALTPIQIQILIFLRFHSEEKCKVSYLAGEFNLSKPTISDTVKTLEQKQLI